MEVQNSDSWHSNITQIEAMWKVTLDSCFSIQRHKKKNSSFPWQGILTCSDILLAEVSLRLYLSLYLQNRKKTTKAVNNIENLERHELKSWRTINR